MRNGQGVRTGLRHGGITCVLQTQFSSFNFAVICVAIKYHICSNRAPDKREYLMIIRDNFSYFSLNHML